MPFILEIIRRGGSITCPSLWLVKGPDKRECAFIMKTEMYLLRQVPVRVFVSLLFLIPPNTQQAQRSILLQTPNGADISVLSVLQYLITNETPQQGGKFCLLQLLL